MLIKNIHLMIYIRNGSRLGFYDPIRTTVNKMFSLSRSDQKIPINIFAGAMSGVIGAILGNPLFLVKARMQAFSPFNPVGAQHNYRSPWHAISTIIQAEGARGLARGVDAAILRTAMGSSVCPSHFLFDPLPFQVLMMRIFNWSGTIACI